MRCLTVVTLCLLAKASHAFLVPSSAISSLNHFFDSSLRDGDFFDEISNSDDNLVPIEEEIPEEDGDRRLTDEELAAMAPEWANNVPKFAFITLVGRVGNNPEPRYFDNGKVVLNLSLAVKRKYHPLERATLGIKSGEEETDWFNLEIWGRDAEYASKYVTKGARIGVSGQFSVDEWKDKQTGGKRQKCNVIVRDLEILETKAEAEMRRGNRGGGGGQQRGSSPSRSFYNEDDDDSPGGPYSAGTGGFFD